MRKGTEYLVGVCLCQIVISVLVPRGGCVKWKRVFDILLLFSFFFENIKIYTAVN